MATMRKTLGPTVRFTASGAGYDTTKLARTKTELVDVIGKDNKIIQKTVTVPITASRAETTAEWAGKVTADTDAALRSTMVKNPHTHTMPRPACHANV